MRVLLVEDEQRVVEALTRGWAEEAEDVQAIVVSNREDAERRLLEEPFDLLVCDLKIYASAESEDPDTSHGRALYAFAREQLPDLPVIVLSGWGDVEIMRDFLEHARQDDPFGEGTLRPMLRFIPKSEMDACVEEVAHIATSLTALQNLELARGSDMDQLTSAEDRALRIFTKRRRGTVARIRPLEGGLSAVPVLRMDVAGEDGRLRSRVVAKLGSVARVIEEMQRYDDYVSPFLPAGCYSGHVDSVHAGAQGTGGNFYGLAPPSEYDRNVFDLMTADDKGAASTVETIRRNLAAWQEGAQTRQVSVRDIRRQHVSDERMNELHDNLTDIPWEDAENRTIQARTCPQHGDLHGANVLVDQDSRPMIIDFGHVGEWTASLDPVQLELSLLFHPQGREICGDWPQPVTAAAWADLESYLKDCPFPQFVRECRAWAFDFSDSEPLTNAYVLALRAIGWDKAPSELAVAVASAAVTRLVEG